jgi:hypothetical protein
MHEKSTHGELVGNRRQHQILTSVDVTNWTVTLSLDSDCLHTSKKKGAPPLFPAEKAISAPLKGAEGPTLPSCFIHL